jgi:hypothetical protein
MLSDQIDNENINENFLKYFLKGMHKMLCCPFVDNKTPETAKSSVVIYIFRITPFSSVSSKIRSSQLKFFLFDFF